MYVASHGVGPRIPVINRRATPTEGNDFQPRSDVLEIVEHPKYSNVGYVRLYERPVSALGTSGMITVINMDTGELITGTNTFPPGVDQYFVAPYQQLVFFNECKIGTTVRVDYTGMGSIIDAIDFNYVYELAAVNKFLSGDIEIGAGATLTLEETLVTEVYVLVEEHVYKLATTEVDIFIHYPDDMDNYYSTIVNNDANNSVTVKYRATHLFIPEK